MELTPGMSRTREDDLRGEVREMSWISVVGAIEMAYRVLHETKNAVMHLG